jgi:tetratricopeptide (TPR) repeat protein
MDKAERNILEKDNTDQYYKELLELADHYASVGDYTQAQQYYGQAASVGPDEPSPYIGLGLVALEKDLLDEADVAFRVASRLDNNCSRACGGLAMVAQRKGDHETAFEMYLKCLELNTDNLTALLGLFQTSCRMGSFAKVIHYLEVYLTMHPEDNSVKFSLAALYVRQGDFEQSKKILLGILLSDPENDDALNLLEEVERSLPRAKHAGVLL